MFTFKYANNSSSFCIKKSLNWYTPYKIYARTSHVRERAGAHIYNNVYSKMNQYKLFISVKFWLKSQLFCEKIWWNGK